MSSLLESSTRILMSTLLGKAAHSLLQGPLSVVGGHDDRYTFSVDHRVTSIPFYLPRLTRDSLDTSERTKESTQQAGFV